jgi:hypothetical protein
MQSACRGQLAEVSIMRVCMSFAFKALLWSAVRSINDVCLTLSLFVPLSWLASFSHCLCHCHSWLHFLVYQHWSLNLYVYLLCFCCVSNVKLGRLLRCSAYSNLNAAASMYQWHYNNSHTLARTLSCRALHLCLQALTATLTLPLTATLLKPVQLARSQPC